jgi:TolB protein
MMKPIFLLIYALFFPIAALATQAPAEENVIQSQIEVHANASKLIKLKINDFENKSKVFKMSTIELTELKKSLDRLLGFTGWFTSLMHYAPSDTFDYVVEGAFEDSKNKTQLVLKLFDTRSSPSLRASQPLLYEFESSHQFHLIIKRFADLILEKITGVRGPFLSQIAFIGTRAKHELPQVFVSYLDGSELTQITSDPCIHLSPAWSFNGKKLGFTSYLHKRPEIVVFNFLTHKLVKVTNRPGNSSGLSWQPKDDTCIAFASSDQKGNTFLHTLNLKTNEEKEIKTSASNYRKIEVEPAYSHDGTMLAYTSSRFIKPMIFIRDLKTDEDRRLTYAGWYNASASWSSNDEKLAFASYDRNIDRWDIFTIHKDGSGLTRLTMSEGDNEKPTWSPDDRFILFHSTREWDKNSKKKMKSSLENPPKLYIMNANGTSPKALPIPLYSSRLGSWGPYIKDAYEGL